MSLVINTNIASLVAQQNLSSSNAQLKVSIQRLSSGYRVNSSSDDAAGLAKADQLKTQSRMIQASIRNINDGVSAMEISDKAAEQVTNILTRMGELAASASQGTLDATSRGYYSSEYDKLYDEINRIANTTEFGGKKLLNGDVSNLTLFIGYKNSSNDVLGISLVTLLAGGSQSMKHKIASAIEFSTLGVITAAGTVTFEFSVDGANTQISVGTAAGNISTWASLVETINANAAVDAWASYNTSTSKYQLVMQSATVGVTYDIAINTDTTGLTMGTSTNVTTMQEANAAFGLKLDKDVLTGVTGALSALDSLSAALKAVNDARAIYGASINRLNSSLNNLEVTFTNFQAAESRIRDADFAFETAIYTKNQIMVQAGTSVLAQANTLPQQALTLLR